MRSEDPAITVPIPPRTQLDPQVEKFVRAMDADAGQFGRRETVSIAEARHIAETVRKRWVAGGPKMAREGRTIMHEHMSHVLARRMADRLSTSGPGISTGLPCDLIARHVASTFVLVLNWGVGNAEGLTPAEVDARFRALVVPALASMVRQRG